VDVTNPQKNDICLSDIAWALSRQTRFAGHTLSDEIWSVGQHSLFVHDLLDAALDVDTKTCLSRSLVSFLLQRGHTDILQKIRNDGTLDLRVRLGALLHDASEAYLVDLPTPVKKHPKIKEQYVLMERNISAKIDEAFGLEPLCKGAGSVILWADLMALQIEAIALMPSRGREWNVDFPELDIDEIVLFPEIKRWKENYNHFLNTGNYLIRAIKNQTLQV